MQELHVSLFEMSMCLSNAMDLVSPAVVDHHKRVAYIASSIAAELGLTEQIQEDLIMAGILHDIGALSLNDRLDTLNFEVDSTHAEVGYRLVKTFDIFSNIAPLLRCHHLTWENGKGSSFRGEQVSTACHILHLADRIAVLINAKEEILGQSRNICKRIEEGSGEKFVPELVDIFLSLSQRESFWFDAVSSSISQILTGGIRTATIELNLEELLSLSQLFSKIIDFRSHFTATHSSGVAASAEGLAKLSGLTGQECRMMKIAGYLHDLGKLAVPAEILEKSGRLTREESNVIKNHPYHTYRIIETVRNLDKIKVWASLHHECINGNGYPFHYDGDDIPLGSRIMAVADVFTAVTEDRPYRSGMSKTAALKTLRQMAGNGELDRDLVALLTLNYDRVNDLRLEAQTSEYREYREFGMI